MIKPVPSSRIARLLDLSSSHQAAIALLALTLIALVLRLLVPQTVIVTGVALGLVAASLALSVTWRWQAMLKRPGMMLFHASLSVLLFTLLISPHLRVDAYFELAEGQTFTGDFIFFNAGRLHGAGKPRWQLIQESIYADYTHDTHGRSIKSYIKDESHGIRLPIRFLQPVSVDGFRLSPTGNMGYAAVLTYIAKDGRTQRGVVNFPGYPNARSKQENRYLGPEVQETVVALSMDNPPYRKVKPWVLTLPDKYNITVKHDWRRFSLTPGQEYPLQKGRLRFDGLVRWLGYSAIRDPLAPLVFMSALLIVLGIAWHMLGSRLFKRNF